MTKLKVILRATLTIIISNAIAALLISLDSFLTLRYAPWGHWAVDASSMSARELALRYGDPAALAYKGLQIGLWVEGPIIALLIGLVAGVIFRRADWRVSSLCAGLLIVVFASSLLPSAILAAGAYLMLSWIGMNVICPRERRQWFIKARAGQMPA